MKNPKKSLPELASADQKQSPAPAQLPDVEVTAVAFGGKGIARVEGKVFFVADAVPGDVVDIEVTGDSGRYADAKITKFGKPSLLRGKSPCAFSERCGGCQWHGIPYEQQLAWKRQFVETALGRIGKVEASVPVAISGSPETLEYRNRIFLRGVFASDGGVTFGYFRRGSRDLVPVDRCAIAATTINQVLARIGSRLQSLFRGQHIGQPALCLRANGSSHGRRRMAEHRPRIAWNFRRSLLSPIPVATLRASLKSSSRFIRRAPIAATSMPLWMVFAKLKACSGPA